ncbi:unnamed protein product [Closterium sp. Naga37s-1]|nr:unnamed protein product [Closterium sp. Naga37s-1]
MPPSLSLPTVHVPPPLHSIHLHAPPTHLSHSCSPASLLLRLSMSPLSPLPAPLSRTPAHAPGGAEWGGGHGRVGGGQGAQQGRGEGAAGARGGDEGRRGGTQGGRQEARAHGGWRRGGGEGRAGKEVSSFGSELGRHRVPLSRLISCHVAVESFLLIPMRLFPHVPLHSVVHHMTPCHAATCSHGPISASSPARPIHSPTTRAARQQRVGVQQRQAEQQLASACQQLASLVAPRLQAAVALSHSHALALHSAVLASLSGGEGEGGWGAGGGRVGGARAGRGEEEEGMEERERALMTGIASLQGEVGAREEQVDGWAVRAGLREQQQRLGEFEAHVGGAVGGGEVLVCDRCQQPIDPLHAQECSRQLRAEVEETQRQLAAKQQVDLLLCYALVELVSLLKIRARGTAGRVGGRAGMAGGAAEGEEGERGEGSAGEEAAAASGHGAAGGGAGWVDLKAVQRYTAAASQALDSLLLFLHRHQPLPATSAPTAGLDGEGVGAWRQEAVAGVIREARDALAAGEAAQAEVERWRREAERERAEGNPHEGERRRLVEMLGEARGEVEAVEGEVDAGEAQLGVMKQVDSAFGLAGVQSFVLEGALWELDAHVARYLAALSGGALHLHLSPTRAAATATKAARGKKSRKASGAGKNGAAGSNTDSEASSDSGGSERGEGDEEGAAEEAGNGSGGAGQVLERIDKSVRVRLASGELVPRALRQLSGGERRRVALALALAFAELAAERSGVRFDLLVLDEVFQARCCCPLPPTPSPPRPLMCCLLPVHVPLYLLIPLLSLPFFLPCAAVCVILTSPLLRPRAGSWSAPLSAHPLFSLPCILRVPHLDDEGVAAVAAVLRSLPQRTVVVVSQANSREALAEFGVVDWVVKRNDVATVELAHM